MLDGLVGGSIVGAKGANVCSKSVGTGVAVVDEVGGGIGWAIANKSTGLVRFLTPTAKRITVATIRCTNSWLSDLPQYDDWRQRRRSMSSI